MKKYQLAREMVSLKEELFAEKIFRKENVRY
jgi:hypothetical protein